MIGRRLEATITIYFCLSMVVVAALILALVEAVRYEGLNTDANQWTDAAAESLCAGYQPLLLEEYDIFALDGSFGNEEFSLGQGEEELEALLYDNLQYTTEKSINFYRMGVRDVRITEYTLLTDDNGQIFMAYIADLMKSRLGKKGARKIYDRITKNKYIEGESVDIEQSIVNAKQNVNISQEEGIECNPLEDITLFGGQDILNIVLPSGKSASDKVMDVENSLLHRKKKQGTGWKKADIDWYERILVQEYFKSLGGNFIEPKEDGALSYGIEYLIWGESSDEKNLKKTINYILLLREAANYLYLRTDAVKQAEALSVATALAGGSANPAVIAAVKQGILAAWAYAESILDVKALLCGGKIPLKKTAESWKSGLSGLASVVTQEYKGETQGLSYEDYLEVFLYTRTEKTMAYRMLDLMEQKLREQSGCQNCRMDYMLTAVKIEAEYVGNTIFFGIFAKDTVGGYGFKKTAEYIYQ
ncbi:MAG: hypothetical protein J6A75_12475 [Lachnospiraceae bacterium]|nr:hypothetical protein [Lachnospiraceae bacterium]